GISNYSTVVSDVYQDVFKEGTYIGKGIYNISAFHQILHKTIPENSILSHDLLESCYVKTAFVSTANIMDNFPSSVLAFSDREHRWIRGDWQLLPWLYKKNLSGISRWKILDNMRRSLLPLSKTFIIISNLLLLPHLYFLSIILIFFSDLLNLIILIVSIIIHKIRRPKLAIIHKKLMKEIIAIFERAFIEIFLIPYKTQTSFDAIIRTLYRLMISKKNLLKWKTSENIEKSIENTKKSYFLHMWKSLIPAAIIIILVFLRDLSITGITVYLVLALLWVLSPLIAYRISLPNHKSKVERFEDEEVILREAAIRMWQFFKDFSTKENNWLCPDNYQMANQVKITSKTSPTNIGLQLLSVLSARDFGFETLGTTLDYIENILYTVAVLPKWKGHLFNWYNIKSLDVLNPAYISTVDSGNFFGDLIALKSGMIEQKHSPDITEEMKIQIDGLCESIDNMLAEVDFSALYNEKHMLFHIGYHTTSQVLDAGCYDLMASEALLTSFIAVARGEVPLKHWYKLGRPLTMIKGIPAFVSWSGSMFEYLMPNLLMREYEDSVFAQTSKAAVLQHIKYAKHTEYSDNLSIPWGISESQYYRFDLDSNYQYRAFGVPKLRLQPSVTHSMVVAPYATMLALDYAGKDAILNLKRMTELGAFGKYGFYESIDFNAPD
ncbi:MAG: glucoamylase family protein, partial [Mobilitalea sp.]